jgi:chaperonin GroEL
MSKKVLFGDEARDKLLEGINLIEKTVGRTLGPRGRNSILSRGGTAAPVITNDGVSISSFFNKIEDLWANEGVQMIKEVASKQNEPGDGTTTATVIAAALSNEGVEQIKDGAEPNALREGINRAAKETIEKLIKSATQISTKEEYVRVAKLSVEDDEIGQIIGEMMFEAGKDGAVTVETSKEAKLEKDMAQGIKFEQGWVSPYMMTNVYRRESVYENAPILVTDQVISTNEQFVHIAEKLIDQKYKAMVIICDEMKGEALHTAITNTIKPEGAFGFLVITLPGLDEWRSRAAEDIAVSVGARFIPKGLEKLDDITVEDLGSAKRVIAKEFETIIVNGGGSKKDVKDRIEAVKAELKSSVTPSDRDLLKERIARLSGGIGVLRIGAATDQELNYKKLKIEDALAATRAAVEEGIVAGGGVALLRCFKESTDVGENIFYHAIQQPIIKIIENAGKNPETITKKVLAEQNPNYGWDAKTDEYKDLFEAGIIDPVKVTRKAVENAVSMASIFLTAESLIVDVPEAKND